MTINWTERSERGQAAHNDNVQTFAWNFQP
jgi:hypothetical protein